MSAALEAEVAALKQRLSALEGRLDGGGGGLGLPTPGREKLNRIVNEVAEAWNVDAFMVSGQLQQPFIVQPRFAAMWLARRLMPHLSLTQLGRLFDRDHTSVRYGLRRADGWYLADEDFKRTVERILSDLRAEFAVARR